jgi:N-acetylglutamate synthase-like GNAT family acetyltransferase
MPIRMRDLGPEDRETARDLLRAHDMSDAGLADGASLFVGAFDGETLVGLAGLDQGAGVGLLRSLLVIETRRRGGIGAALVDHLTARAWAMGARRLYLFAAEREARFAWLGWKRAGVPELVAALADAPLVLDFARRGWLAASVAFRYDFER